MTGSGETKEAAAGGLSLLVALTSAETLAPYVMKMTGPLIRVASEHGASIKVCIGFFLLLSGLSVVDCKSIVIFV